MEFLHTRLKLKIPPPVISPNMQNNNQSISPQPSHLPPSPHDPDHVTNNDSSHAAAEQVGFQEVIGVSLCFVLGCLRLLLFASLMCHLCAGNKQHNHSHSVQ